ncbi:PD-(D/E)XK nuclease family protein [Natrarchaeobaculum sulfurireducens]|uniref:Uncharacterized protein n=1 Tax=Natrarchaeobaculum sulfurireducens TaxID=2044521 RepID=A0A346PFZ6_9EURY|nr:PD-(D/E)XK nuclease family protein [Natrarchaeobaculum sulfurireducens]AXR78441.1 hypothetical protein AArc1_2123 [Natrarchaeobaculum sulfurireducens]AXR81532.1 hypothetical protein AArcMg_1519 [Natrarchaeobaculum sulfurireducens]
MSEPTDAIPIEAVRTWLHCPRRYEFAHVDALEPEPDGDRDSQQARVDVIRRSICTALRRGEDDADTLYEAAVDRLATLWDAHDERFHSRAQRTHERTVLEATLRAYIDEFGADHAAGIRRLEAETDGEVIGPVLPLARSVSLPAPDGSTADGPTADDESTARSRTVRIDATVDYVYADGSSIVGVRFVPTLAPLGLVRYRSDWEGDVERLFTDHFDTETDAFDPEPVAALFETSVVLEGLRRLCDRLGLERRTCRYVQLPLADRTATAVNWIRGTVETSLEVADLTDAYVDHHTFGMTLEHRNRSVDDRLARVVARLLDGGYAPADRWPQIERNACPDCEYAVCCPEYIASEVRFDG